MSLTYREVRKLSLAPGEHPRGLSFLSAASGLVRVQDRYYVVADDELHLGVFDADGAAPLRLVRLFEGELPASAKKRKARKPDLESLLFVPATVQSPHGSLLALGSGSRANRFIGAMLSLDSRGDPIGPPLAVDLAPLHRGLAGRVESINIEGAFIAADELVLLQRGNEQSGNAALRFDLAEVMAWLGGEARDSLSPHRIDSYDLGSASGVALTFTDGAALPDGSWLFSAVAEAGDDSYDDGACVGAAVGIANGDGSLRSMHALSPVRKVEGVAATVVDSTVFVSMVSDADDPDRPAEFGTAQLPLAETDTSAAFS